MVTECPVCQEAVTFEVDRIEDKTEVVCASCLTTLSLKLVLEPVLAESGALTTSFVGEAPSEEIEALIEQVPLEGAKSGGAVSTDVAKKVLLCLEGEATRELVAALLEPENIHLIDIPSEMDALVAAYCPSPDIALIDLDLNRDSEIDLCAEIRKNPIFKDSRIIVIGSMFEKDTCYRDQKPVFPGADDFIDRYFLKEELLGKILKTEDALPEEVAADEALTEQYKVEDIHEATPEALHEPAPESDALETAVSEAEQEAVSEAPHEEHFPQEAQQNAEQIARDVIADMMHCNEDKVEEGIRAGKFYDFLVDEIGESRKQYETQVSEATRAVSNYFEEILEEKFQERKDAQNLDEPLSESAEPLLTETDEVASELNEEIISSDLPETSFDGFEATELGGEGATDTSDLLQAEASPALEIEVSDENQLELPAQEDALEAIPASSSLEPIPDFKEQVISFENSLLIDEQEDAQNEAVAASIDEVDSFATEALELSAEENLLAQDNELLQEDAFEPTTSSLNLDPIPDFEEQVVDFETTSLVDEQVADDEGFSLEDEASTEALPLSDVVQEKTVQAEVPTQNPVTSGFDDTPEEETPAIKTAKRLARIIVSDIVIYNEKKVEEGLQKGQFFELLSEEIDEGRQLYHSRVDKDRLERDYLQEALTDYINKKTSVSS